jgi:hypothetical protein
MLQAILLMSEARKQEWQINCSPDSDYLIAYHTYLKRESISLPKTKMSSITVAPIVDATTMLPKSATGLEKLNAPHANVLGTIN